MNIVMCNKFFLLIEPLVMRAILGLGINLIFHR